MTANSVFGFRRYCDRVCGQRLAVVGRDLALGKAHLLRALLEHILGYRLVRGGDVASFNPAAASSLRRGHAEGIIAIKVQTDGGIFLVPEKAYGAAIGLGFLHLQKRREVAVIQPRRPILLAYVDPQGAVDGIVLHIAGDICGDLDEREGLFLLRLRLILSKGRRGHYSSQDCKSRHSQSHEYQYTRKKRALLPR